MSPIRLTFMASNPRVPWGSLAQNFPSPTVLLPTNSALMPLSHCWPPPTPIPLLLLATLFLLITAEMNFRRILVLSLYQLQMASGVFWNWVLTNPHQVESDSSVLHVRQDQRPIDHGDEDRFRLGHQRHPASKSQRTTTLSPSRKLPSDQKPADSEAVIATNKLEYVSVFMDGLIFKPNADC